MANAARISYSAWTAFEIRAREDPAPRRNQLKQLKLEWNRFNRHHKLRLSARLKEHRRCEKAVVDALRERDAAGISPPLGPPPHNAQLATALGAHLKVRDARRDLVTALRGLRRVYQSDSRRDQRTVDYVEASVGLSRNLYYKDATNYSSLCSLAAKWHADEQAGRPPRVPNAMVLAQLTAQPIDALDQLEPNALQPWLGGWMIGAASDAGALAIWARQDAAAQVLDRVVVKDMSFADVWDIPFRWQDQEIGGVPMEAATMYLLDQEPNIVRIRGHFVDVDRQRGRLYVDFCTYGDLHDLWNENEPRKMPEPFIWHLFETLAEAILKMHNVTPINVETEWVNAQSNEDMVHADLKPINIFMDYADPTRFPCYPTPKIGDFGIAILTCAADPHNPAWYTNVGTPGFMAPEQSSQDNFDFRTIGINDGGNYQLLSKTNLWGIAHIIWCVMNKDFACDEDVHFHGTTQGHHPPHNANGMQYSRRLRHLVTKCLRRRSEDRPPVGLVRRYIARVIQDTDVARGMDTLQPGTGASWTTNRYRINLRGDEWVVGKHFIPTNPPSHGRMLPSPEEALDSSLLPNQGRGPPPPPNAQQGGHPGGGGDDDDDDDDDDDNSDGQWSDDQSDGGDDNLPQPPPGSPRTGPDDWSDTCDSPLPPDSEMSDDDEEESRWTPRRETSQRAITPNWDDGEQTPPGPTTPNWQSSPGQEQTNGSPHRQRTPNWQSSSPEAEAEDTARPGNATPPRDTSPPEQPESPVSTILRTGVLPTRRPDGTCRPQ